MSILYVLYRYYSSVVQEIMEKYASTRRYGKIEDGRKRGKGK